MRVELLDIAAITLVILAPLCACRRSKAISEFKRARIQRALLKRYTYEQTTAKTKERILEGDRCLAYCERILDRQINKARGILPVNALALATISILEKSQGHTLPCIAKWVILGALTISTALCLAMFIVQWGEAKDYKDFETDIALTLSLVRSRTILLLYALFLTGAAFLSAALILAFR